MASSSPLAITSWPCASSCVIISTIFCCASSTSRMRMLLRYWISCWIVSRMRADMLLKMHSLTSSDVDLRATARSLVSTSRTKRWMAKLSSFVMSSKTNISLWICSASSGLRSSRRSKRYFSVARSTRLTMSAT